VTTRWLCLFCLVSCIYPDVRNESNFCVNIMIDPNNCGSLGNRCPSNSSCSAGICSDAPGIQLLNPTPIWSSSINGTADDQMYNVILPWAITLYNTTTNNITVTTNGVSCISRTNLITHVKKHRKTLIQCSIFWLNMNKKLIIIGFLSFNSV
jgi:hypothetical protein